MLKINFNLKSPKEKESLILVRFSLPAGRITKSTGLTIPTGIWDEDTQYIDLETETEEKVNIHNQLEKIRRSISDVDTHFYLKKIQPTVKAFMDKWNEKRVAKPVDNQSFQDFLDKFIANRAASVKYREESIKVYKALRKHLYDYERRKVHFSDLTLEFLLGFLEHLYHTTADNTVNKIVGTMKTVLNQATEMGLNSNMAYKSKRFSAPKREADNIYLSEDEIEALCKLQLPKDSDLARTRDLFVIGCYTGLRYSDFSKLTKGNLMVLNNGRTAFRVVVYKTNDIVIIPIHPVVKDILDHYDYEIPEGNSNQMMNRQLKEIARRAGITQIYQKRIFRNNQAEIVTKEKCDLVCTHTARRSFASNAYKAKIPVPSIMKITGHKKTETFMKYISLSKQEHAELMSENPFFQ